MTDHSNPFDPRPMAFDPRGLDHAAGQVRRAAEVARLAEMKTVATPPVEMRAAPMAPARGPQLIVPLFAVTTGGMRRRDGVHMRTLSPLAQINATARQRHEGRGTDAPFAAPFTPGQITVAEDYAALVEWRDGSAIKCASLEGRTGGGGSGLFIDAYLDQGAWLAELHRRIGDGVAMSQRRHMDRGNARRAITVRAAVDMLVLAGVTPKAILRRFGWVADMKDQRALRNAICGALDRMQGYRGA